MYSIFLDQFMKPGTVNYKPHEMVISNMNLHWVNDLEGFLYMLIRNLQLKRTLSNIEKFT